MKLSRLLLGSTALAPLGFSVALANPLGGQVVGGRAAIQGQGTSTVTVNQTTPRAIINWQTFNIDKGETTRFIQPSPTSVILNRVVGGFGPSMIYGTLTANGRVFLVNPDGVLVGKSGVIDTAGFVATTHDIRNEEFMAGRYAFNQPGRASASIVNEGMISVREGGVAALVAPGVRNSGTIVANLGAVGLAAGNGFTLDFYGDKLVTLGVSDAVAAQVTDVATGKPLNSLVSNDGKIKANGGRVELSAVAARKVVDSVINTTGVIEANTIGTKGGMIVLGAATDATMPAGAPAQVVKVSGRLSAAGKRKNTTGGTIQITGQTIHLAAATLNASGRAGGGKVLIGGDTGGGVPSATAKKIVTASLEAVSIATASNVSVDAASTINVSANDTGNGGKAILWSTINTQFAGSILARGGARSGAGGFVETSSHGLLGATGSVDLRAMKGKSGTWLLDPQDVTIASSGASVVTPAAIQSALATGDVVVTTGAGAGNGDITVAESLNWANANALTLSAYRNIAIFVPITNTGGAAVNLRADNSGTGVGSVGFGPNGLVSTSGQVSIFYNPSVSPAGSGVNGSSYVSPVENFTGRVTGGGTLTAYMLVNSVYDLQNIQNNLSGNYALGKDIDASATAGWNGGDGFVPLGSFSGLFDGQKQIVDGLAINCRGDAGLFFFILNTATVRNVILTNEAISVSGNGSDVTVGGLAAANFGVITGAYINGNISGSTSTGHTAFVGGLVGANLGIISTSRSAATVQTPTAGVVGGLVGTLNGGSITQSFATGSVTAGSGNAGIAGTTAGGLVGVQNSSTISQSYATGVVSVGSGANAGGLVGVSQGNISQSYAAGSVSSPSFAGGLVARNFGATITQSYWDTQTTGRSTSNGGTPKTTVQLKSGLPTGFDPAVWAISPNVNSGYPYLKWQTTILPPPNVTTLTSGSAPPATKPVVLASLAQATIPKDLFANGQQTVNFTTGISTAMAGSTPATILPTYIGPESNLTNNQTSNPSVAEAIAGTQNKPYTGTSNPNPVEPVRAEPTQTTMWFFDAASQHLVRKDLTLNYAPIDTLTIKVNGQDKTIATYPNVDDSGNKAPNDNGKFQCTALVANYLDALGINAETKIGNGKDVAKNLGKYSKYFNYSVNGAPGAQAPKVGSIISMTIKGYPSTDPGHVAIVKGVESRGNNTIIVTLIEQNATIKGDTRFDKNRQITFTNSGDTWVANNPPLEGGTRPLIVSGWATPMSLR